jgi:nucleotide-binding universal stress UspA family protein
MSKYKHILVPVDLSAASDAVILSAIDMGNALQAALHIIHVHKVHAGNLVEGGMEDADALTTREATKLKKTLDEYITKYAKAGITMTTAIYSGEPYVEILQAADKTSADMIIMGTHGRTGVAHLVIGSVAENVLRHARVPVMAIRC